MFLFLRLVLAHFLADFPLQFPFVYRWRLKSLGGNIFHGLIMGLTLALLSWPYLKDLRMICFLIFLVLIHATQDWTKIISYEAEHGGSLWGFLLDQSLHLGAISLVFLTGLTKCNPVSLNPILQEDRLWIHLYRDNRFILYLLGLVVTTFVGYYLLKNMEKTFSLSLGFSTAQAREKYYDMLERTVVTFSVAWGGGALFFLALLVIPRLFIKPLKVLPRFGVNLLYAGLIGIVLRLLL